MARSVPTSTTARPGTSAMVPTFPFGVGYLLTTDCGFIRPREPGGCVGVRRQASAVFGVRGREQAIRMLRAVTRS